MNNNINIDNNLVNLKDILDNKKVIVPIIQRGYAQGRTDAEATDIRDKFLDSIIKYLFNENDNNDFILDIIYGVNDDNIFYPIDGQQRLTTLFLFHWYIYDHLKADRTFLSNFSYETRITSTDFLSLLNSDKINIDFDKDIISNQIISNISFLNYYRKDPTVKGILLVLDEIHKKIKSYIKAVNNKEDILKRLDNIKFFKLDIKGDYDDLYIKMNSRGKQLTDFEIFKSKLEKFLDENVQGFDKKIDVDWTNFIWDFIKDKKSDNEGGKLDDLFMKLFLFIFEMLYYSQIEIVEDTRKLQIEKSNLKLFELFFSHIGDKEKKEYINKLIENENYKITTSNENINFIINIFDILSLLGKDNLNELFNIIFYHNNESKNDEDKYNKICTFDNNLNVFNNNDDNLFEFTTTTAINTNRKRILIFSVFKILNYEYLKNKENIKDIDNIKNIYLNKLRLIRNLLYNTNNLSNNNIYYQMKLIDRIINENEITVMEDQLSGQEKKIEKTLFTNDLVKSEKNKLTILENTDENTRKRIYACENNVFLQGNIDFILDYLVSSECNDNVVYIINNIFIKVGFNNKDGSYLIHRAMLSFICKQQIIDWRTIYTSKMYKDYNIWNNKENNNDKEGFINFIKSISSKINNDNIEESTKESIKKSCENIIEHFEEKKDENDFRYLLIKDAKDGNGNRTNLFRLTESGTIYNTILKFKTNYNVKDTTLNTNIFSLFYNFKKTHKEFELFYHNKSDNVEVEKNRVLIYSYSNNNEEILYCYSWVTLAKEIEIENEKVLVGFTTNGYCLECGLRKKIPYRDENRTENILTKIEEKKINFEGYERWTNNIHWDYHWYYYKYFNTCDNISLLDNEYKILKPVIDAFLQNK